MTEQELAKFAADTIDHARRFGSICVYWNIKHARAVKTATEDFVDDGNREVIGVYGEESVAEWVIEDVQAFIAGRIDGRTGRRVGE